MPSRAEWTELQKNLIELEKEADVQLSRFEVQHGSIKLMEMKGNAVKNMCITDLTTGSYGRQKLTLEPRPHIKYLPNNNLSSGDIVGLYQQNSQQGSFTMGGSGIICSITRKSVTVFLNSNDGDGMEECFLDDDKPVVIHKLANDVTYRRINRALTKVQEDQFLVSSHLFSVLLMESTPLDIAPRLPPNLLDHNGELDLFNRNLNESQIEAIKFAIMRPDLAIIHGPPGTGKTTAMVEAIQQHVKMGCKILVSAPSNIAVDNLVEKLAERKVKLVRLGHPARATSIAQSYTLDALLYSGSNGELLYDISKDIQNCLLKLRHNPKGMIKHQLNKELTSCRKELRQREDRMMKELLETSQVVLCTLTNASNDGPLKLLQKDHFQVVFIDECSQSIEAACYIAALNAPKLILAGDHQQLPPTVLSQVASNKGLSLSLMERVINDVEGDLVRMLKIQYRMNEKIMSWSSNCLYDNQITANSLVANHKLAELSYVEENEDTLNPLLFIDTASCDYDEYSFDESMRCNLGEAALIAIQINKLLGYGLQEKDIAVITPYNFQVEIIKSVIKETHPGIEIRSVDGFQGREKEAVLISLVRSNKKGNVGFLSEKRRLNVAVTRARRFLSVVCDSRTVSSDPFLKEFIEYLNKNAVVHSAHEYQNEVDQIQVSIPNHFNEAANEVKAKAKLADKNASEKKPRPSKSEKFKRKPNVNISSSNKLEDEDRVKLMDKYKIKLNSFIESFDLELTFPSSLTSFDRCIIHEVAETLNLVHESHGEGANRHIVVSKKGENGKSLSNRWRRKRSSNDKYEDALPRKQHSPSPESYSRESTESLSGSECSFNSIKSESTEERENTPEEIKDPEPEKFRTCYMCRKEIPFSNFTLHKAVCERTSMDQKNKKKKANQSKKAAAKVNSMIKSAETEEDIDNLLNKMTKMNQQCSLHYCEERIDEALNYKCRYCDLFYCYPHSQAELHGCGEKARQQSRLLQRGGPSKGPSASQRSQMQKKMNKKLEEMSNQRRAKPKKK